MGKFFQQFLKLYFSTQDPKEFEQKLFDLFTEIVRFFGFKNWNLIVWNDVSKNDYKIATYAVERKDLEDLKIILNMMLKNLEGELKH
ncbi:hypothetical protein DRN73_08150 [Candidatus Pacearchaeota archaeon]|nr:MAG: hypothetical protein DRN73_08150 [Candidatus Pacearchaeota archaeon]